MLRLPLVKRPCSKLGDLLLQLAEVLLPRLEHSERDVVPLRGEQLQAGPNKVHRPFVLDLDERLLALLLGETRELLLDFGYHSPKCLRRLAA